MRVRAGTAVAVAVRVAAIPFWNFTAGTTKSRDLLTVEKNSSRPFVNYGVQSFYAFTIAYDEISGTITLVSAS